MTKILSTICILILLTLVNSGCVDRRDSVSISQNAPKIEEDNEPFYADHHHVSGKLLGYYTDNLDGGIHKELLVKLEGNINSRFVLKKEIVNNTVISHFKIDDNVAYAKKQLTKYIGEDITISFLYSLRGEVGATNIRIKGD